MSSKFRARKLDLNRAIPVYRWDAVSEADGYLEDLLNTAAANDDGTSMRALPHVATGVDKEEEVEVHLQTAITAAQMGERAVIPTPIANVLVADYEELFPRVADGRNERFFFPCPATSEAYVRLTQSVMEERLRTIPRFNDTQRGDPAYELAVDCFEEAAARFMGSAAIVGPEAVEEERFHRAGLPMPSEEAIRAWLREWHQLVRPALKTDEAPGDRIGADPYVCFRRRQLKNQVRKTRRSDAQIADKLRRLRYDLEASARINRLCALRDRLIAESVRLNHRLFALYSGAVSDAVPPPRLALQPSLRGEKKRRKKKGVKEEPVIKISLPASVFKTATSSALWDPAPPAAIRYNRPQYAPDVLKVITRDIDALLAADGQLSIPGLSSAVISDFVPPREVAMAGLLGMFGAVDVFKRPCDDEDPYRWHPKVDLHGTHVVPIRRRRRVALLHNPQGRAGSTAMMRVLNQRAPAMADLTADSVHVPIAAGLSDYPGLSMHFSPHYSLPRLRILPARDCAQLNNARVGNLNQHYLQLSANLATKHPQTLVEWISATNGLLMANSNRKHSANGPASPTKRPKTNATPSPRKKSTATSSTTAPPAAE